MTPRADGRPSTFHRGRGSDVLATRRGGPGIAFGDPSRTPAGTPPAAPSLGRRRARAAGAAAAGLLLSLCASPPPVALAGDGKGAGAAEALSTAAKVGEKEAKAAMLTFEETTGAKEPERRRAALLELAKHSHPLIAQRLLRLAVSGEPAELRVEAFRALARQGEGADRHGRTVAAWLEAEVKESRKATARGDFGLVMDRKIGEPVLDTPEGKAALDAKRARARVRAAAVDLLAGWRFRSEGFRETVIHFLQDGDDGLVASCLGLLGAWKDAAALPGLLALHRMYPAPSKWETGAVADLGGTDASAKAKWMAVYGDPDKRRPRPAVVKAVRAAAEAILGTPCESPADLEAAMKEAGRRRR